MANLDLFNVDDQELYNELISSVENEIDEKLYPGDERLIFLEALTAWIVAFLTKKNEEFNQRFSKYAKGRILDVHGENEDCVRLLKTKSTTSVKFSLSSPITSNVIVSAGTRVTADDKHYFATDVVGVILAGETSVTIPTTATEGGEDFNNFEIGAINKLVDRVEYIATVSNLTVSSGGDNGEPYPEEDGGLGDSHFYNRIRLARSSKSTAGAETTYEYYAKSADPTISDVKVTSPEANKIKLIVTCSDGSIPSADILKKVEEICSKKNVRPLGDVVEAVGVTQVSYDIEFTYYTSSNEENATVTAIEGSGGAIERYNSWQSSESGININPDRLRAEILKSDTKPIGADRVVITKPVYTVLDESKIAKWSGKMVVKHELIDVEVNNET